MHQTLEKSMFSLLFKKNYSISILHGSESLPVVVITIHPPKGRQATPKGQPKGGEVYFPSLYGSPGRSLGKISKPKAIGCIAEREKPLEGF